MKKSVFGFLVWAGSFAALEAAEFQVTSTNGRELTFATDTVDVTRSTQSGVLCAAVSTTFTQFRLWMPDHGHGSTATKIVARDDGLCADVHNINFVMSGRWQLKVMMSDGDAAVFTVNVQ